MNLSKMTRNDKVKLYIKKHTELQKRWKSRIHGDWEFVKEWSDDQLDEEIKEIIGQLRFEKIYGAIPLIIAIIGYTIYTILK